MREVYFEIFFLLVSKLRFISHSCFLYLQKDRILDNGQTVLLELGPRDPRSLIQGDYMVLRYKLATGPAATALKGKAQKGSIVLQLDEHNVAHFVRIYRDNGLKPGEILLNYKRRRRLWFGAESFFFQEGHAKYYISARYGELKVAPNGAFI